MKNNKLFSLTPLNTDLAILLLRLIVGGLFVRYGYNKFADYDKILPMMGDPIGLGSKLSFNLLIFAELFCGFFVLIGLFTRLSIIPIFISMIVAYFVAHAKDPFDVKAISFVFMLLCLVIFILGSGRYSVDRLIFGRNNKGVDLHNR